ncbi:MAG TPA: PQQ-binding-like beta-propeller repeat protein [Planctomycetota bacterium]|nr:PQQ-binding-like beta-propeller repeat protein [Planctomycetota bacterium]
MSIVRILSAAVLLAGLTLAPGLRAGEAQPDAKAVLADSGVSRGLCLAVGCDPAFAKSLAAESRLFVQLLAPDEKTALEWLRALDAGPERASTSALCGGTNPLPYARDTVNLLVVRGGAGGPSAAEVARVLTPGGTAVLPGAPAGFAAEAEKLGLAKGSSASGALVVRKAQLPATEDWGNLAGGPELGNSLPGSTMTPTMTLRWRTGPRWAARDYHFDGLACGAGVFVVRQIAVVPGSVDQFQRVLIARDAYNGRELWRHADEPTRRPMYGFGTFTSLLAIGEGRICVERDGKLVCLEAATGKLLYSPEVSKNVRTVTIYRKFLVFGGEGNIAVHSLDDGKRLWAKTGTGKMVGAIKGDAIFVPSGAKVIACRLDTGAELWTHDTSKDEHPEVEFRGGVYCTAAGVHYAKGNKAKTFVFGLDQKTGKPLWCSEAENPHTVYPDVKDIQERMDMVAYDDEIWYKFKMGAPRPKTGYIATMTCFDAATGKAKRKNFTMDNESTHCWWTKGAGEYMLYSRNMFFGRRDAQVTVNGLIRSVCGVGHIPAERQMFNLAHNCRCGTLVRGVVAMGAPEREYDFEKYVAPAPLAMGGTSGGGTDSPGDWPTFRGTPQRSSGIGADIGSELKKKWETPVGGAGLTQATAAYGMVFLADGEGQRVVALDAENGAIKWSFPAGGRVDYPPTLHRGMCLVGTSAGWVWGLDAKTGTPVWKLRAAPDDCLIGSQDRFESRWPVVGGVLVLNGVGYASAGRAGTLDGGVQLVAFDPLTGKPAWNKAFREVVSADLLVATASGSTFLMNAKQVDLAARTLSSRYAEPPGSLNIVLYSIGGLGSYTALDDYFSSQERHNVCQRRELLGDGKAVGTNAAFTDKLSVATVLVPRKDPKDVLAPEHKLVAFEAKKKVKWEAPAAGMRVDGLVMGQERLYWVGGSPSDDPNGESTLQVWSAADGKSLKSLPLAERAIPEGLSIAGGRALVVTRSGKVICYQGDR